MITKIDTQIPEQTNRRILAILLDVSGWGFGKDVRSVKNNVNKKTLVFYYLHMNMKKIMITF